IAYKAASKINYDIRNMESGKAAMLTRSSGTQKLNATYAVSVWNGQQMGTYKLSSGFAVDAKKAFTINMSADPDIGAPVSKIATVKLGAGSVVKNGVSYAVSTAKNVVSLTLAVSGGEMKIGNAKANKLAGTADSDIFYGGKGNDTITGVNGRDVAVYDKTAWGKDTVKATGGTTTLLFAGFKESDITQKWSGTSLVLTRKGTSQKVTVEGAGNTTTLVYTDTLTQFTKYMKAASPTTAQTTAARNEVWKKAGLAKA
ncbi:MAG: hypothetical protein IKX79_04615, partial [Desulfovibrionaceae bacterium]|nr:hypothetical protein [Desulfovibrionaceae bacterium]